MSWSRYYTIVEFVKHAKHVALFELLVARAQRITLDIGFHDMSGEGLTRLIRKLINAQVNIVNRIERVIRSVRRDRQHITGDHSWWQ